MTEIKARLHKIKQFVHTDLWKTDITQYGFFKRTFYQSIKVVVLSIKHFKDDKLQLQASALTFFTLLSIVPVLAMAFGFAKGFGLDKELEVQILERFSGQEEVLSASLEFARKLLDNTKGGLVAGIGLAFLFYTVMQLLGNIERSFNDIWYVTKHRSLARKLTDYLSIMILAPVLLIVANSLTITITREIAVLTETVSFLGLFKGFIFPLLRLLPFIVVWALFSLIFLIMPNTNVNLKAGVVAGIIAGTAFQIVQWGLIYFGVGVAEYNAIYGSFAALPLFLVWLQLSWLIVLVGAELSYAIQNVGNHEMSNDDEQFSIESKKRVALSISLLIIRNFKEGLPPLTFHDINNEIELSDKLVREVILTLIDCQILTETKTGDDEYAYQPAQDTDRLDVSKILSSYENSGLGFENGKNEVVSLADATIEQLNLELEKSKTNRLLKEL